MRKSWQQRDEMSVTMKLCDILIDFTSLIFFNPTWQTVSESNELQISQISASVQTRRNQHFNSFCLNDSLISWTLTIYNELI